MLGASFPNLFRNQERRLYRFLHRFYEENIFFLRKKLYINAGTKKQIVKIGFLRQTASRCHGRRSGHCKRVMSALKDEEASEKIE